MPILNLSKSDVDRLGKFFTKYKHNSRRFYPFCPVIRERAKELITYGELSLTEIAFKLHYSSVAHLSNQFKKITSLSPTSFKKFKDKKRKSLAKIGLHTTLS